MMSLLGVRVRNQDNERGTIVDWKDDGTRVRVAWDSGSPAVWQDVDDLHVIGRSDDQETLRKFGRWQ